MPLIRVSAPIILPNGNEGFTPCPELLTEDEAIRYLRLDIGDPRNPSNTLKYYKDRGVLRGVRIWLHFQELKNIIIFRVTSCLQKVSTGHDFSYIEHK